MLFHVLTLGSNNGSCQGEYHCVFQYLENKIREMESVAVDSLQVALILMVVSWEGIVLAAGGVTE